MKFIMRIDDVGYSHIHNYGSFRAIDEGIATSADVMLECPGTVEALEFLRERPWISVGWHTHFWGSPVLPAEKVPSLVEVRKGEVRFKKELSRLEDVNENEIYEEMRAQIERCITVLGRTPDTGAGGHGKTPFSQTLLRISKEYGMPYDIFADAKHQPPSEFMKYLNIEPHEPTQGHIYSANPESVLGLNSWKKRETMTVREAVSYDPWRYFLEDPANMLAYADDEYVFTALHPGNIDEYVMSGGSNINYYLCRPIDTECLCSKEIHDWIKDNNVELCNFRDALYGTRSYQNHLRHVGSDLYRPIA